jgi:4-diphosphocytidyl-2-C-methyl-D-erythritol kinase
MRIKSFAKVNLGLEVIRRREDGYHEVRTLLQTVNLYDILEFHQTREEGIVLTGDDPTISWESDNLIYRAALLLKRDHRLSGGIEIQAAKNIPPGKGLGGGSSNAAMTLYALNEIWGLDLDKNALMDFGKKLGADVPFFLEGGLCLGKGRGDEVASVSDLDPLWCLMVLPRFSISTASVYGQFQPSLTSKGKDSKIIKFLDSWQLGLLENGLEETVFRLYPQLKPIKAYFQNQGSELSLVSGSGSAVFGLFSDRDRAEKVFQEFEKKYPSVLVETLPREQYWEKIKAGV